MSMACDYLVLGAGAQGIAFTDALVTARPAVSVVIADRRNDPGGMWNDTYAFAKLDEPSAFFGLSASVRLEGAQPTCSGGLSERASKSDVLPYFKACMAHLIKNRSVQYFPNYVGEVVETLWLETQVRLTSTLVAGKTIDVIVRKKVVDSEYGSVPAPMSSHTLLFEVDPAVNIVRPHELGTAHRPMSLYVVIGAGKTGLDTVLWLLSRQVPAEKVRWIVPRDSWYYVAEAGEQDRFLDSARALNRCMATSESAEDLYLKLEESGICCRIDEQHFPEVFHGNWMPRADLAALRAVPAIRLGHVRKVATDRLLLEHGSDAIPEGALCIDCTGNGKRTQKVAPIFSAFMIKLQRVVEFSIGPSEMSAPFCGTVLGFVEATYPYDTRRKNSLCTPAPSPDHYADFIKYHHLKRKKEQARPEPRLTCFLWWHPSSRYHRLTVAQRREFQSFGRELPGVLTNLEKITPAVGFSRLQGRSDTPAYDAPTPENDEAKGASRKSEGAAPENDEAKGASCKNEDVAIKEHIAFLLAGQAQRNKDWLSVFAEGHELKQSAMVAEAGQQRQWPA